MKKFKVWGSILGILLIVGSVYIVFFANYSTGYRVGTIIKMTKKGVIFKTIEGQLHTGGISGDAGAGAGATSMWDFSVRRGDNEIEAAIEDAVNNGYRVKLYYDEKFYQWAMFGDTKYFINKVEPISDTKPEK